MSFYPSLGKGKTVLFTNPKVSSILLCLDLPLPPLCSWRASLSLISRIRSSLSPFLSLSHPLLCMMSWSFWLLRSSSYIIQHFVKLVQSCSPIIDFLDTDELPKVPTITEDCRIKQFLKSDMEKFWIKFHMIPEYSDRRIEQKVYEQKLVYAILFCII
jgi:hypothetical protein